jgi:hypothetical protein
MSFEKNVFVNCPFDTEYLPLLRPLLFSIIYLKFVPRIALEQLDSGQPRFEKIVDLVRESKYAIHDLSRIRATTAGEYFRLNMPFELGFDVACKIFKPGRWASKRCLILEAEQYRYKAALSDLSSSDISVHHNEPVKLVSAVRNWLNNEARLRAAGPAQVWGRFNDFMADNYRELKLRGFSDEDIDALPIAELIDCMGAWVAARAG